MAASFHAWLWTSILLGIGTALGALLAGILADVFGIRTTILVVAALTLASGISVAGGVKRSVR